MLNKAIFIDYKDGELDKKVFDRMSKNFNSVEFAMRDDKDLMDKVKDAEAFFVKITTKVDKKLIDASPKLKYVGVCSTAFDAIDAKYAREKGVDVCNLGGYSTEAVAEFFFAALFEHSRELERAKQQARKEDYSFASFMGVEMLNKTLGVIGPGKIGSRVAEIGLGIGMKVVYYSRSNKEALDKAGAKKVELDELLKTSDFISLNLVLNDETRNIISKEKIDLIKKDCVFISLSPPHLIDEQAIMKAAGKGHFTFIYDHSDDSEYAKEILGTKNCITYPAIAFRSKQADFNRWDTFAGNIEKLVEGKPQNVVN